MTGRILNERFWQEEFAVTDGDVSRIYEFLRQSGQPERAMKLLALVVRHKLEQAPQELDTLQRQKSLAAAQRLLQEQNARVYCQTDDYRVGERVLVAWEDKGEWQCGIGVVVCKERSGAEHYRWNIWVEGEGWKKRYAAGADLTHPQTKGWTPPFDAPIPEQPSEQSVDQILRAYGAVLIPHLWGRLRDDDRFVCWGDSCWLAEALPSLPQDVPDRAAAYLWARETAATTDDLLRALHLPADEPHRWALNRALTADGRFENTATETEPRWKAKLPDRLIRLADGKFLDLSLPPDRLWADYHELFRSPLPLELADHPRVFSFSGRWLPDVLLAPLTDDDLRRIRELLVGRGEAVSAEEILKELFGITPQHGHFERWRFALGYQLQQKGQELGVEFVGVGQAWRWAVATAPEERPERPRRLRGTERLPITYTSPEQIATALTLDDEWLDVPEEKRPDEEWSPTRQTWEYVLTYYDWAHGVLPYNRQAREIIPPLAEGQRRAVFRFLAEQVDDRPFEVALYADPRAPWLSGQGLKDLFAGYLVPGAFIWVDRTEDPVVYKIRYRPTPPQRRRLIFFEEGRLRPVIQEVEIACEVDESMLLAEGRYTNIEALRRLDAIDRRTAPRVLATIFEVIGEKDEARGVYRARFNDIFPLLCVTKPYSRSYVQQILYDQQNYPWFYHDPERGGDWFVYEPRRTAAIVSPALGPVPRPVPSPKPVEGIRGEVSEPAEMPSSGPPVSAPEPPEGAPAPPAGPLEVFPERQEMAIPPAETIPPAEALPVQPEQREMAAILPVEALPSTEAPSILPELPEAPTVPPAAEMAPPPAPQPVHPRDRALQEAIAAAIAEPVPPPEPPSARPESVEALAPPPAEPMPPAQPKEVRPFFIFVRWLRKLWSRLRRARLNL